MKTENARSTRSFRRPAALLATAFATALTAQSAFAMVGEHDLKATEASESSVLVVSGAGPRGDVTYIRSDAKSETVGYELGGPVGRLVKNPAE